MTKEDVILSELQSMKEFFQERFDQNNKEHAEFRKLIIEESSKIRILEDWKLVFVAKYTAYSAVALFFGSVMSTIAYQLISKYL